MNINYTLIGSHPELEDVADTLPALIAEYEAARTPKPTDLSEAEYKARILGNITNFEQASRGVLIELLAAHVYGIDASEFSTIGGVIDAIKSMDDYVQAH